MVTWHLWRIRENMRSEVSCGDVMKEAVISLTQKREKGRRGERESHEEEERVGEVAQVVEITGGSISTCHGCGNSRWW
ncbi:unnamed protein product [Arabidopsis halleri]